MSWVVNVSGCDAGTPEEPREVPVIEVTYTNYEGDFGSIHFQTRTLADALRLCHYLNGGSDDFSKILDTVEHVDDEWGFDMDDLNQYHDDIKHNWEKLYERH